MQKLLNYAQDLDALAELILKYNSQKLFRLPPSLKNVKNLKKLLTFTFAYYKDGSQVSLKNAAKYIDFCTVSASKTHLWLQQACYAIRISFIKFVVKGDVEIDDVAAFFFKELPNAPLVVKSALNKYKFIHLSKYKVPDFMYCCLHDFNYIDKYNKPAEYVDDDFKKINDQDDIK
jgi:hypothetical protein